MLFSQFLVGALRWKHTFWKMCLECKGSMKPFISALPGFCTFLFFLPSFLPACLPPSLLSICPSVHLFVLPSFAWIFTLNVTFIWVHNIRLILCCIAGHHIVTKRWPSTWKKLQKVILPKSLASVEIKISLNLLLLVLAGGVMYFAL